MQIECPECGTRYRVDAERLRPEGTRVRCSTCNHRFLAFPEGQPEGRAGQGLGLDGDGGPQRDLQEAPVEATEARLSRRQRRRDRRKRRTRPVRQADSGRRTSSLLLGLLVLLLLAGLLLELGYAFRSQLLAKPWVRSTVEAGLELAEVDWELPIALRHYRVEGIDARLVTLASGRRVTLLEGRLVNRAPFAQRPPRLELRATGPEGEVRFRRVAVPGRGLELEPGMDAQELGRRWQQARAAVPASLAAAQEMPFEVVLTDVPPGVRRFQVEVVE